ncbi:unnamed protein product [Polarella glacialis]|uniref:Uncharacterized protein n=1 Tax=Polarella glacialis TaxID=89957 RepID=A0A813KRJ8_POLGL|nr:unnamed protein product [Polarella glacialis]
MEAVNIEARCSAVGAKVATLLGSSAVSCHTEEQVLLLKSLRKEHEASYSGKFEAWAKDRILASTNLSKKVLFQALRQEGLLKSMLLDHMLGLTEFETLAQYNRPPLCFSVGTDTSSKPVACIAVAEIQDFVFSKCVFDFRSSLIKRSTREVLQGAHKFFEGLRLSLCEPVQFPSPQGEKGVDFLQCFADSLKTDEYVQRLTRPLPLLSSMASQIFCHCNLVFCGGFKIDNEVGQKAISHCQSMARMVYVFEQEKEGLTVLPCVQSFLQKVAGMDEVPDALAAAKRYMELHPRIEYVVEWLHCEVPAARFLSRSIEFEFRLCEGSGTLHEELLSCDLMSSCRDAPGVQREFRLRLRVAELLKFLTGRLNRNELRLPEVLDFVLRLQAGLLDEHLQDLAERPEWSELEFAKSRIGAVLGQCRTYAIQEAPSALDVADAPRIEAQVEARVQLEKRVLEEGVDRRVRQRTEEHRKEAADQQLRLDEERQQRDAEKKQAAARIAELVKDAATARTKIECLQGRLAHFQGRGLSSCSNAELHELHSGWLAAQAAYGTEIQKRLRNIAELSSARQR